MKLLQDKVALITGASRGIGYGIAKAFASQGAHVAFTYLSSDEKARQLEAELETFGVKAKGYKSDASDFAQAEALVNQVVADFGGLEVLVNNAGITRDTLILRMTETQWDEVMNTNLKSVFNLILATIRSISLFTYGSIGLGSYNSPSSLPLSQSALFPITLSRKAPDRGLWFFA